MVFLFALLLDVCIRQARPPQVFVIVAGPYHLLHWAAHPNSTTSNSINVRASIIQGWNLGNITSHFKIEYPIIHLQCKNEYNRSPLTRTPKENEILVTLTERGRVGREGSSLVVLKISYPFND